MGINSTYLGRGEKKQVIVFLLLCGQLWKEIGLLADTLSGRILSMEISPAFFHFYEPYSHLGNVRERINGHG
jgi:hypothetical protein